MDGGPAHEGRVGRGDQAEDHGEVCKMVSGSLV